MKRNDRAIVNYQHWHKKDPTKVINTPYEFPKYLYKVGNSVQIFYYSDKWHDDGDGHIYYHDFDSRPAIYVAETSKVIGCIKHEAALQPHSTKSLTGIANLNGSVPLPVLATMEELTIDMGGYKQRIKFKSEQPPMCCSADRKSLIFLSECGPIVIRGSKMRVTERGIVN